MATKKAETKTETKPKTEDVKVETADDYVDVFVPIDDNTDEEFMYVAVNGVGINVPYGETAHVKQKFAAEINRKVAMLKAERDRKAEAKRKEEAYTQMYVNGTGI